MPRLNPFALPVETDARFGLLITAVPLAVLSLAMGVLPLFYAGEPRTNTYKDLVATSLGWLGCDINEPTSCDAETWASAEATAVVWLLSSVVICPGGLIALAFALAGWRYNGHVGRVVRKSRARQAVANRDVALLGAVEKLAGESGLAHPPTLYVGPAGAMDGQAFGSKRAPRLRLGPGLRLLRVKAPDRFRAIVLHELGHIANGDVERAYWAEALWRSLWPVIALCLAGVFATNVLRFIFQDVNAILAIVFAALFTLFIAFEAVCLLAVIVLIWRGLLRVREFYADAHAESRGAGSALRAILATKAGADARPGFWPRLHPTAYERLRALQYPELTFAVRRDTAVTAGFLLAVIASQAVNIFDLARLTTLVTAQTGTISSLLIVAGWAAAGAAGLLGPWLGASMLANTIGLQVVRNAVADLTLPRERRSRFALARATAWAVLGFEAALWVIPYDALTGSAIPIEAADAAGDVAANLVSGLIGYALWLPTILLLFWGSLHVLRFLATWLLARRSGPTAPLKATQMLLHGVALVWAPLLLGSMIWRGWLNGQFLDWQTPALGIVTCAVVAGLALVIVAGVTLATSRSASSCPACRKPIGPSQAIGVDCAHCGRPLASWLYQSTSEVV